MELLLLLAQIYNVSGVPPLISNLLEDHFPPTFSEWVRVQDDASRLQDLWAARCAGIASNTVDDLFPLNPASAVYIALKYNMPSILPAAFYALSTIDFQDDWDRWRAGPAEQWRYTTTEDVKPSDPLRCGRRTAQWARLEKDALMKVILGKRALQGRRAVLGRVFAPGGGGQVECVRQDRCPHVLTRLAEDYNTTFAGSGPWDPLQALLKTFTSVSANKTLCKICRIAVRTNINGEMVKLWKDLPQIFSLGGQPVEGEGKCLPAAMSLADVYAGSTEAVNQ